MHSIASGFVWMLVHIRFLLAGNTNHGISDELRTMGLTYIAHTNLAPWSGLQLLEETSTITYVLIGCSNSCTYCNQWTAAEMSITTPKRLVWVLPRYDCIELQSPSLDFACKFILLPTSIISCTASVSPKQMLKVRTSCFPSTNVYFSPFLTFNTCQVPWKKNNLWSTIV